MVLGLPAELSHCATCADIWPSANAQRPFLYGLRSLVREDCSVRYVVDQATTEQGRRNPKTQVSSVTEAWLSQGAAVRIRSATHGEQREHGTRFDRANILLD